MSYPPNAVEFARRMGENGYRICDVQAALAKRGVRPHGTTIAKWIDPDYADAQNMRRRRWRQGRVQRGARGWEMRLARLHELRGLGLSFTAIAAVLNHDLDTDLNKEQVRQIANGQTSRASTRTLLRGDQLTIGRPRA